MPKTFNDWWNEQEGFGFRSERAHSEINPGSPEALERWLRVAYDQGAQDEADERDQKGKP